MLDHHQLVPTRDLTALQRLPGPDRCSTVDILTVCTTTGAATAACTTTGAQTAAFDD